MTPAEREAIFRRARHAVVRRQTTLMSGTRDDLVRLLKQANVAIREVIAMQPSDYERWSLPRLGAEVRRTMEEFGDRAGEKVGTATGRAWEIGEQLVDAPIEAAGKIRLAGLAQRIDTRQLQAMRAFVVDRIKDLSVDAGNKIVAELGLVIIGARSSSDAISAVTQILGESSRARATMIVRDNLGRAFSLAAQLRKEAAVEVLPGLQKQWRRSSKKHPRLHHDLADGQIRDVKKPFELRPFGKPVVHLMFPRDPKAPAGETINCGCLSIPYMAHWKVKHPGRVPGSPLLDGDDETLADVLARQRPARAREPA